MELKTEEFKIEGIGFKIKEIDTDSMIELAKYGTDKVHLATKELVHKSIIEPKDIDLKKLPSRIGMKVIDKINKLNGLGEGFPTVPGVLPKRLDTR